MSIINLKWNTISVKQPRNLPNWHDLYCNWEIELTKGIGNFIDFKVVWPNESATRHKLIIHEQKHLQIVYHIKDNTNQHTHTSH